MSSKIISIQELEKWADEYAEYIVNKDMDHKLTQGNLNAISALIIYLNMKK